MRKAIVLMAVLAASVAVAQAAPLQLQVGAGSQAGTVSFTMSATTNSVDPLTGATLSTTDSAAVTVYADGPLAASDKAGLIAQAVGNAGEYGTWRAVSVSSTVLAFEHLVGNLWVPVDTIASLVDTTGSGTLLTTPEHVVAFSLNIDPSAVAVGFDAQGLPSYLTVSVTNTLTFTQAVQPGDTAAVLVSEFQAFLAAQQVAGMQVILTSPTSLSVTLQGAAGAAFTWQLTDLGLSPAATATAAVAPSTIINAGLIDR